MGWRSIVISHPSKISVKDNQLVIEQEEKWSMPIEDLTSIVIENPQVVITMKTLELLSDSNVTLYVCDNRHIPIGYLLPYYRHSRQLKIINQQLSQSEPFKKRLWQQIIKQKIINQAYVLMCNGKRDVSDKLIKMAEKVDSGDTQNIEAQVAKIYFETLFNKNFNRNYENTYNACLDYGYSILRGAIARNIAKYGFIPSLGIHHKSELNNYNLGDDIIEPFRPIVDFWIIENIREEMEFTKEIRGSLVDLLNYDVIIDNKRQSVSNAINVMISSYTTAIQMKDYSKILLPRVVPLERHEYE
ncbi:MAG: type II CRISPR-associated endonuclease Cas1 [Clostridia bacterium]|nr:type II CRISPR-associated endonuclease Cas1 [Clostridia bacterium]